MKYNNIVLITAGGIGQRFESSIPKQYMLLNKKPVISYVIDACKNSSLADLILVAAAPVYHKMLIDEYGVEVCEAGDTLNKTKKAALDYIKRNYKCKKIVIVDAVRPTITSNVIDSLFWFLDNFEAAACARKITDSLGSISIWQVDRNEYFTINAPEAFLFDKLYEYFDENSQLTETIQQLPPETKVYYHFDVPYFEKITYPGDIRKIELLMVNETK